MYDSYIKQNDDRHSSRSHYFSALWFFGHLPHALPWQPRKTNDMQMSGRVPSRGTLRWTRMRTGLRRSRLLSFFARRTVLIRDSVTGGGTISAAGHASLTVEPRMGYVMPPFETNGPLISRWRPLSTENRTNSLSSFVSDCVKA